MGIESGVFYDLEQVGVLAWRRAGNIDTSE